MPIHCQWRISSCTRVIDRRDPRRACHGAAVHPVCCCPCSACTSSSHGLRNVVARAASQPSPRTTKQDEIDARRLPGRHGCPALPTSSMDVTVVRPCCPSNLNAVQAERLKTDSTDSVAVIAAAVAVMEDLACVQAVAQGSPRPPTSVHSRVYQDRQRLRRVKLPQYSSALSLSQSSQQ